MMDAGFFSPLSHAPESSRFDEITLNRIVRAAKRLRVSRGVSVDPRPIFPTQVPQRNKCLGTIPTMKCFHLLDE